MSNLVYNIAIFNIKSWKWWEKHDFMCFSYIMSTFDVWKWIEIVVWLKTWVFVLVNVNSIVRWRRWYTIVNVNLKKNKIRVRIYEIIYENHGNDEKTWFYAFFIYYVNIWCMTYASYKHGRFVSWDQINTSFICIYTYLTRNPPIGGAYIHHKSINYSIVDTDHVNGSVQFRYDEKFKIWFIYYKYVIFLRKIAEKSDIWSDVADCMWKVCMLQVLSI